MHRQPQRPLVGVGYRWYRRTVVFGERVVQHVDEADQVVPDVLGLVVDLLVPVGQYGIEAVGLGIGAPPVQVGHVVTAVEVTRRRQPAIGHHEPVLRIQVVVVQPLDGDVRSVEAVLTDVRHVVIDARVAQAHESGRR